MAALTLASLVLLAIGACGSPGRKLALSLAPDGAVVAHYKPCNEGDALVTRIKLVEVRGNVYGDADDPVLWDVAGASGSAASAYTLGVTPSGFDERVALGENITTSRVGLLIYGKKGERTAATSFRRSDLRADFVLSEGEYLPEAVFFKKYTCW